MRFHRGGRLGAAGQGRGAVMAHHFDVGEQRKFSTPWLTVMPRTIVGGGEGWVIVYGPHRFCHLTEGH